MSGRFKEIWQGHYLKLFSENVGGEREEQREEGERGRKI